MLWGNKSKIIAFPLWQEMFREGEKLVREEVESRCKIIPTLNDISHLYSIRVEVNLKHEEGEVGS